MVQFYLLSVVFLILSAGLLLVDKYGTTFLFLINLKTLYTSRKVVKFVFLISGLLIAAAITVFPISPGPVILGDVLPASNIILVILYFLKNLGKNESVVEYNNGKRNALGFVTLGVALIHFLFPAIVII
ncbi:MAG: hypothetical protein J6U27_00790 [Spirochaetales bacterium]|nr:hypothetical protein [Spirochaetales bacterium]MBP5757712.1 hypothetical protein [Spirochaetales bacterium]